MGPGARKKLGKVVAIVLLAVVAIVGLGWLFAVPHELKTILGFSRWHDSHVRASGYVEREPAGTRVYWEEFGKADGPPVVVLPAGLCTITVMVDRSSPSLRPTVGWSDGGNLGLDLARRYPDRIRKVVAFGANHTPAPDGADPVQVKEFKDAKPDAAMLWPLRRMYETSSPTPEKWPEFFEQERTMVFSQPNWSLEQLASIRARVLLINGERDLVLLPYATEMKNAIPGARLEVIPGGTHECLWATPTP